MAKMRRLLAAKLLADLPQHFADGKKLGIDPPSIDFKYSDGLTRAEAKALYEWGLKVDHLRSAYGDRANASHAAVRLYADLANYFTHDHPQTAAGEPANWTEALPAAPDVNAENPFQHFTRDQADDWMTWARTRPEFQAYYDTKHPQHELYIKQMAQLGNIAPAGVAPDAIQKAMNTAASADGVTPEAQARIDALIADPAYRDRSNPRHEMVKLQVQRACEEAAPAKPEAGAPGATPGAAPGSVAPKPKTPEERIAEIRAGSAWRTRSDPGHAAATADLSAAYSEMAAAQAPASAPAEAKP